MVRCPVCGGEYEDAILVCPEHGVGLVKVSWGRADGLAGEVLDGRFRLVARIGAGGMGSVYRAVQTSVGRDVAVKVLHGEQVDAEALARFRREVEAVSRLRHPNIVGLIEFGGGDSLPFMVMELVEGPTLAQVLRQGPLGTERALDIAEQCASALAAAHRVGVIHRDLKPANLILDAVGPSEGRDHVKLLDFGVARLADAGEPITRQGQVIGTPQYMAPEQAAGGAGDERTDVYLLGLVLYAMLAGRPPFEGAAPLAVLRQQLQDPPPPLTGIAPDVVGLVSRMLAKEPARRPQSAIAARDALRALRQAAIEPRPPASDTADVPTAMLGAVDLPSTMRGAPVEPAGRSDSDSGLSADGRSPEGPSPKAYRSSGPLLAAGVVALALGAAASLWILGRADLAGAGASQLGPVAVEPVPPSASRSAPVPTPSAPPVIELAPASRAPVTAELPAPSPRVSSRPPVSRPTPAAAAPSVAAVAAPPTRAAPTPVTAARPPAPSGDGIEAPTGEYVR